MLGGGGRGVAFQHRRLNQRYSHHNVALTKVVFFSLFFLSQSVLLHQGHMILRVWIKLQLLPLISLKDSGKVRKVSG